MLLMKNYFTVSLFDRFLNMVSFAKHVHLPKRYGKVNYTINDQPFHEQVMIRTIRIRTNCDFGTHQFCTLLVFLDHDWGPATFSTI